MNFSLESIYQNLWKNHKHYVFEYFVGEEKIAKFNFINYYKLLLLLLPVYCFSTSCFYVK